MELFRNYQPKRKKLVLSTRRKMNVLSALNSDSKKCLFGSSGKDSERDYQNIFDHGKEVMSFLQSEQFHIESLKHLKKCLVHPVLKGNIESSDDIIGFVDEMLSTHSSLCSILIGGKNDMSYVLKELSSSLDTYISYSVFLNLELKNFQKLSETYNDIYIDFDLLQEPMTHISRYKTVFQNLYSAAPDEAYSSILKTVEITSESIQNALSLRENALRTLKIQRYLFKREPKILSPGRMVLKEGILYKVNPKGNGLKERIFFLFNDIFLCCKVMSNVSDWHKKDSLLFRALFPLNMCVVSLVMGSAKQGTLFKVACGTLSYLLISKIPGEAQSWFDELHAAIRICQKPNVEFRPKLNRGRNISLKHTRRIPPFLKKPLRSDIKKEPKGETINSPQLHCKKSSHGSIIKFLACVTA